MTIFPKMYTLEIIRKQPVVIQTIFWHMGMGNLLLVFKIIFVLMAHTDGITIWKHPSTVILSDNFMCMSYSSLVLFCCFLYVLLVNAYKKWTSIYHQMNRTWPCILLHLCIFFWHVTTSQSLPVFQFVYLHILVIYPDLTLPMHA